MLDSDTKRRIDSCRDILVGKVPDPKSQVEQITIALIYKFMDDMDAEAEELGGARSFFTGDHARFGWARLMAPGMGGFEVLALYSEAIGRMNQNPGIPPLFRDIFKNAYLPYRDPETLRAFLKEIDGFTYDHSERLGDAFEYLLSVLGSQGDAGQFRTPRHIIDFMVEVIDPKKNESILDPACGTAGFLISAWKHILKHNTTPRPQGVWPGVRVGDMLTPEERANLAANIHGYDISPDMVRLSLVNLYLHGFSDPHIVEYDTLTNEERWNETADVILANPPFMSPKGGIKPHKRFSVQATRSEVLFVDYMAEHLSPQGRAAIVVPEGIIFQSGTAYKKLREMLVKNSLVAVVSLPAGVFNPYSGVKTSILILDKRLAKTCDSVLFVKVANDGFGLGAQRRAVTGSDLPEAKRLLDAFFATPEKFENGATTHKVVRAKIGEKGEWNISGDRYRIGDPATYQPHLMVKLGDVCESISDGDHQPPPKSSEGVPFITISNVTDNQISFENTFRVSREYFDAIKETRKPKTGDVLFTVTGSFGIPVLVANSTEFCFQRHIALLRPSSEKISPEFLFQLLKSSGVMQQAERMATGMAQKTVALKSLRDFSIPLPPLAIQQEIVAEIESHEKRIDELKQEIAENEAKIKTAINRVWGEANLPVVEPKALG
ncbi:MAG: N-6 DNA methylase [Candidatus Dechloromonas phosphoritropha]